MSRAVSDVIGFVLVFSLIMLTVGIVYASGTGGLENARESARIANAERAFDVLDENVGDVIYSGVRSRSTEVKLSNARIGFGDLVAFNVTLHDAGVSYRATATPIVFTIDGTHIVYVNGGVFRVDPSGSVMLDEPRIVAGDRTLIPLVVTRGVSSGVSGSGRVLVRATQASTAVQRFDEPPGGTYDATLNVTTSRTGPWKTYLESKFDTTCTVSGDTVSCPFTAQRVDLMVTRIDVVIT